MKQKFIKREDEGRNCFTSQVDIIGRKNKQYLLEGGAIAVL